MDGFETARQIFENHSNANIPIVFVTAVTAEKYKHKGYQSGAVDYLYKPFQPEILLNKTRIFKELWEQKRLLRKLNPKLTNSSRALRESNRDLKDFAHVTSHELKQPTSGIQGSASILLHAEGKLISDEGRKYLSTIIDSSARMNSLAPGINPSIRCRKSCRD